jgi:hypothetical protein
MQRRTADVVVLRSLLGSLEVDDRPCFLVVEETAAEATATQHRRRRKLVSELRRQIRTWQMKTLEDRCSERTRRPFI